MHFFLNVTYSRWTSSLPSCLWPQRMFPSLPGSRLTIFYRGASSAHFLPLVNQWLNFTYSRSHACRYELPLRNKEHKFYFGNNRTHDFRTSRCAGYLLGYIIFHRVRLCVFFTLIFRVSTIPSNIINGSQASMWSAGYETREQHHQSLNDSIEE